MTNRFNLPEKYARLTKQQAINVGQWVYYDRDYVCQKGHTGWRRVYDSYCRFCAKSANSRHQSKSMEKDLPRKKVDDALFEKKMQKMIDQDYLD